MDNKKKIQKKTLGASSSHAKRAKFETNFPNNVIFRLVIQFENYKQ